MSAVELPAGCMVVNGEDGRHGYFERCGERRVFVRRDTKQIGGATRPSAVAAVLLGAVALTFPLMAWLDMVGTPLRVSMFPGS